jgi:predicted DNA-binding transcriptional regulator AlpA|tara:strand:+ start:2267 stop:2482 length:216 start_codon:yes stop_codon:yes gene_type:complete
MKSHSKPEEQNHIFMTMDDVRGYLRVKSRQTIYRWIKDKDFPKPIAMAGERTKRWDMAKVAEWVASQNSNK